MTGAQAAADDNAAWYVSFNPENSFYIFKNAATGHYLTYNAAPRWKPKRKWLPRPTTICS